MCSLQVTGSAPSPDSAVSLAGRLALLLHAENQKLRIMIVEDDALIGMLLSDMLEIMGHEVCAIEATECGAVKAAAKFRPEMMIVDAHLRDGSGMAAVDQIIAHSFVAHLFVTGDQRSVSRQRPGAVVISKPFTEATLANALSRARVRTALI